MRDVQEFIRWETEALCLDLLARLDTIDNKLKEETDEWSD